MSAVAAPLRRVLGLDDELPRPADATVVMIDFQNTYRATRVRRIGAGDHAGSKKT